MDITSTIQSIIIAAAPLLIAITFHEVAHGLAAYWMGDKTAKMMGRLTLNPIKHIDPFGTIAMPLLLYALSGGRFVFGYAKPVPISPVNFKNPKRDMAISAAAGPGMNVVLAIASLLLLKLFALASGIIPEFFATPLNEMLQQSIFINIFLAALNLMPVPPLDGGRIVTGLLADRYAYKFAQLERYGMIIVIILYITGLYRLFVIPVFNLLFYIIRFLDKLF
jgi:Zn-dependent protease